MLHFKERIIKMLLVMLTYVPSKSPYFEALYLEVLPQVVNSLTPQRIVQTFSKKNILT